MKAADRENLILVHETKNLLEAKIIKDFLKVNDIECFYFPDNSGSPVGGYHPTGATTSHILPHLIYVHKKDKAMASKLLKDKKAK